MSALAGMKNFFLCGIFTALFVWVMFQSHCPLAFSASTQVALLSKNSVLAIAEDDWIDMPPGARAAYIGIHGGTMPVSLLAAKDGKSMVAFIGQTGNDFFYMLRKYDKNGRPASFANIPIDDADFVAALPAPLVADKNVSLNVLLPKPGNNATILVANTNCGAIPVIYTSGQGFSKLDLPVAEWLPFGLSEKPLSMEGQVGKPTLLPVKSLKNNKNTARWSFGNTVLR